MTVVVKSDREVVEAIAVDWSGLAAVGTIVVETTDEYEELGSVSVIVVDTLVEGGSNGDTELEPETTNGMLTLSALVELEALGDEEPGNELEPTVVIDEDNDGAIVIEDD